MPIDITIISDLHGYRPKLPGGDLIIVAGDLTASDTIDEHADFVCWLSEQNYNKKIFIAGNHDGQLEGVKPYKFKNDVDMEYLCDSGTTYKGLKIWGSPWTPMFCAWSFMKKRGAELREVWELIPKDTDILITHGPAYGILDEVILSSKAEKGENAGCEELRIFMEFLPNLKLHACGHIHESYGTCILKRPGIGDENNIICVNACLMDGNYNPINKPIQVAL